MWAEQAERADARGEYLFAGFCSLLALPNENEREHACLDHSVGFSRDGRRGFKCGICKSILKWVDPDPNKPNDPEFRARLERMVAEDKEILDRLANDDLRES